MLQCGAVRARIAPRCDRLVEPVSNALFAPSPSAAAPLDARVLAMLAAPLDVATIAAALGAADVEAVLRTGSTNTDLLGRFREQAPLRPLVYATLEQTAGRGRHGRAWTTLPGAALIFSIAVPLTAARAVDSAVSLACGLAAAEALAPYANVQLKWPNDLLRDGGKLGGVLCELVLDSAGQRTLVAGIGINLTLSPDTRAAINQPTAALDEGIALDELAAQREHLIGQIAAAVIATVTEFDQRGFAALRARYLARFAMLGREVELLENGRRIASGLAVDIDSAGRIMLLTESGTRSFAGGELSLRAAARDG
jgi:BirA family transcriptional regulator, biotin operon repressor / biotin---[acetyl-CoA-carboxylase] ligase